MTPDIADKYPSLRKAIAQGDEYQEWKDGREQALLDHVRQHPDLDTFKEDPSKLLAVMDDFACQQDFLINIGSDKARVVSDVMARERPNVVVELGGYLGYSAILFARQMLLDQSPEKGLPLKVWSLEFEPAFAAIAEELVDIAGLSQYITVVTGAASSSLQAMHADGRLAKIDLLFIDHGEGGIELYEQDLKICEGLGLLGAGACILADNVVRPGAPDYRRYVRSHPRFESEGLSCLIVPGDFPDEMEFTKVKSA